MELDSIKKLLKAPEYNFLKDNPHLNDKIILLTLGGSHAYGTNVDSSDVDIRGCALNSRNDILGLSNFEQVNDEATDTVIYSFNKLVNLLLNCNPNTIEILGCKPEHYLYLSPVGQELIDNKKLFLSQRAANSFGGYATQQLRRLENALARDKASQELKEKHIASALKRSIAAFEDKFSSFDKGAIKLSVGKNKDTGMSEVMCDMNIKQYPARELQTLLNTLSSVVNNYDKLNCRNKKKDDAHLNKHAMHLIRLYLMCLDILEKGEINTYRYNERDFLLSIRNGAFQNEDGTYKTEFFELVSDYEKRLDYAKKNTALPVHPDMAKVEEFVMAVNKIAIEL